MGYMFFVCTTIYFYTCTEIYIYLKTVLSSSGSLSSLQIPSSGLNFFDSISRTSVLSERLQAHADHAQGSSNTAVSDFTPLTLHPPSVLLRTGLRLSISLHSLFNSHWLQCATDLEWRVHSKKESADSAHSCGNHSYPFFSLHASSSVFTRRALAETRRPLWPPGHKGGIHWPTSCYRLAQQAPLLLRAEMPQGIQSCLSCPW